MNRITYIDSKEKNMLPLLRHYCFSVVYFFLVDYNYNLVDSSGLPLKILGKNEFARLSFLI